MYCLHYNYGLRLLRNKYLLTIIGVIYMCDDSPNRNCDGREQALWRAVILQAFIDLKNSSKKKIANTFRVKATLWFNIKNKDFVKVCDMANLNPHYVLDKANIIKNINYGKYCRNRAN